MLYMHTIPLAFLCAEPEEIEIKHIVQRALGRATYGDWRGALCAIAVFV